jgi:hypothetical protein
MNGMEDDPKPPVRVRESPTPNILRLSLVVYAAVLLTTAIAVGTWLWMRKAADIPIEPSPHLPGGAIVSRMILIQGDATVKPYYIDTTEVTNAEFCAIIHCADASLTPSFPAVNMTVAQARQYASYKAERLPTELEWERAARDASPRFQMRGNVWDLVEGRGTSSAEALVVFAGELKPPRPIPEGFSAPDVGFRCAKDP